jgi:hypothetical protein
MARDTVHYPDAGRTLQDFEDGTWRLLRADGTVIEGGKIEQPRPMTRREPAPPGKL